MYIYRWVLLAVIVSLTVMSREARRSILIFFACQECQVHYRGGSGAVKE